MSLSLTLSKIEKVEEHHIRMKIHKLIVLSFGLRVVSIPYV